MITQPANSHMLFSLAVAILEQYSREDISNVANPMLDDFIATMRVHPSPEAVAKEAAKVMLTRYRECSHAAQQRLFTLAGHCVEEAQHSNELHQTRPYVWVSVRDELYAENYARLLIRLSPVLDAKFFIDQMASMVFCCPDQVNMAFIVSQLVFENLPPLQRFSPEQIRSIAKAKSEFTTTNIQFGFANEVIDEINRVYKLYCGVNKEMEG